MAAAIARIEDEATRTHTKLGSLIELWHELLPPSLVARTVVAAFNRGVLHIKVDSAATSFELDRLLRSGLEAEFRSRFRGTLKRIKTSVEPLDPDPNPPRRDSALKTPAKTPARSKLKQKKVGARRFSR